MFLSLSHILLKRYFLGAHTRTAMPADRLLPDASRNDAPARNALPAVKRASTADTTSRRARLQFLKAPLHHVTFDGPVAVVRCVSPGEVEGIVKRLYSDALEHRKQQPLAQSGGRSNSPAADAALPDASETCASPKRELSPQLHAHEAATVERLYTGGIRKKLETHKRLADKLLFHPRPRSSNGGGRELRDRVVQRFYTEENERKQRRWSELLKQYVEPTEPHKATRTKNEIASIVDRLFSNGA